MAMRNASTGQFFARALFLAAGLARRRAGHRLGPGRYRARDPYGQEGRHPVGSRQDLLWRPAHLAPDLQAEHLRHRGSALDLSGRGAPAVRHRRRGDSGRGACGPGPSGGGPGRRQLPRRPRWPWRRRPRPPRPPPWSPRSSPRRPRRAPAVGRAAPARSPATRPCSSARATSRCAPSRCWSPTPRSRTARSGPGEFYSAGFLTENQKLPFGEVLGNVTPPDIPTVQSPTTAQQFHRIGITPPEGRGLPGRRLAAHRHAVTSYEGYGRYRGPDRGGAGGRGEPEAGHRRRPGAVQADPDRPGGPAARAVRARRERPRGAGLRRHRGRGHPGRATTTSSRSSRPSCSSNKGRADGVAPGDVFELWSTPTQRYDAAATVAEPLARLQVVRVGEHTSSALVVRLMSGRHRARDARAAGRQAAELNRSVVSVPRARGATHPERVGPACFVLPSPLRQDMARRVLVTGGAGFIGSHIAEAYLAAGWDVTVLDDLSRGKASQVPKGVPAHHGRHPLRPGARHGRHRAASTS